MSSPSPPLTRTSSLPGVVQGALYMTAAALCFSVMNVLIRGLSTTLDPLQIAFFRNLFGGCRFGREISRNRCLSSHSILSFFVAHKR